MKAKVVDAMTVTMAIVLE